MSEQLMGERSVDAVTQWVKYKVGLGPKPSDEVLAEPIMLADDGEVPTYGSCKVRVETFSDEKCTKPVEDEATKKVAKHWESIAAATDPNKCEKMDEGKFKRVWCNWAALTVGFYTDDKCEVAEIMDKKEKVHSLAWNTCKEVKKGELYLKIEGGRTQLMASAAALLLALVSSQF